ncbi:MAG: TetR/AcrR family transcriptional regulator [Alphaproteobacteria bacterium]
MSQQAVKIAEKSTDKVRQRAPQKRAEETQDHLIAAAIDLFAKHGFDGVSIRMIETEADVKRGLAAYHFGNKAELWRASMTRLLDTLAHDMAIVDGATDGLARLARFHAAITAFMRFSARHPQLNHVMVQEAKTKSWRADFLIEGFIRPLVDWTDRLAGFKIDAHTHYIMIGAATFAFNVEYECEALFGINPREDAFIEEHAKQVANMLLGNGLSQPLAELAADA